MKQSGIFGDFDIAIRKSVDFRFGPKTGCRRLFFIETLRSSQLILVYLVEALRIVLHSSYIQVF